MLLRHAFVKLTKWQLLAFDIAKVKNRTKQNAWSILKSLIFENYSPLLIENQDARIILKQT